MNENKVSSLILETLEKTNREFVPKAYYPSSASFRFPDGSVIGPDILSQFLKWTGVKPSNPSDGPGIMKMRLGDATHEAIAKILAKSGCKVMSEVSFKQSVPGLSLPVSGRVDGLIEIDAGELEVLEVKSSDEQKMFGRGWGIASKGPKADHILQNICYLNCVPGLRRARFLYVARDTGKMLEFVMEKKPGEDLYTVGGEAVAHLSWAGIVDRWALLESTVKAGIEPAPDYSAWINDSTNTVQPVKTIRGVVYKTPWRVMYDSYRDLIWKNPKNRKFTYNEKGAPLGKSMSEV